MPGPSFDVERVTAELPLEGCSRLLHLPTCREKMFMVMASHSGAEDSAGWAVVGLLASQHGWEDFESAAGASGTRRRDLFRELKEKNIAGIAAGLRAEEFDSIRAAAAGSFPPRHVPDPELICFEHCVLEAARRVRPAPAGETVCFVMDWTEPLASSALWHLEELTERSPAETRERLGALGFESGQDFPPLQAARKIAAVCYEKLLRAAASSVSRRDLQWLDWKILDGPSGFGLGDTRHELWTTANNSGR